MHVKQRAKFGMLVNLCYLPSLLKAPINANNN